MAEQSRDHFQFGRAIALAGVVFAISLALISMTLLALGVMPQIFPTLFPASTTAVVMSLDHATGGTVMQSDEIQPAIHQSKIQTIIQDARTAWVTGDAERFAALFTENGEFLVPGQVYRGRDEIRTVLADFAKTHTDVRIDIQRITTENNRAVIEWHWEDTEAQTGKRTVADDAIVVDFENGQINRWREYIDQESPA